MSTGIRVPLDVAQRCAASLMARWGMSEPDCLVAGSIRRGSPTVGDIDLIAPMPGAKGTAFDRDPLFEAIAADVGVDPAAGREVSLFASASMPAARTKPIGEGVQGVNLGFRSCKGIFKFSNDALGRFVLPVQVERYWPGEMSNRGWKILMRTGPAEFSTLVLRRWKHACGTVGTADKGSDQGFLVDAAGNPVSTPTEERVFEMAGLMYVRPEDREAFVTEDAAGRKIERKDMWR